MSSNFSSDSESLSQSSRNRNEDLERNSYASSDSLSTTDDDSIQVKLLTNRSNSPPQVKAAQQMEPLTRSTNLRHSLDNSHGPVNHSIPVNYGTSQSNPQNEWRDASMEGSLRSPQPTRQNYDATFHSPSENAFANPSSSKAVISALKSLQQKIRKLEQERDFFKFSLETERAQREAIEKQYSEERLKFIKERDDLTVERNRLDSNLARIQERLSASEKEAEYFKKLSERSETERKSQSSHLAGLEETHKKYDARVQQLEKNLQQQSEAVVSQQQKIEELQRAVVRERRRKERAEADKEKFDKALKELIAIHSDLVSANTSIPKKKKKKAKTISRPTSAKIPRKSSTQKNNDIPFLGGSSQSFNVNALTSRALAHGIIEGSDTYEQNLFEEYHSTDLGQHVERAPSQSPSQAHGDLLSDVNLDKPIEKVIRDLKLEFSALQREYSRTLERIRDGDIAQVHQIQLIYHQLQRKAMQVHLLREYKSQIDARLEPVHIPGFEKKIRILKLYRELRKLSDEDSRK